MTIHLLEGKDIVLKDGVLVLGRPGEAVWAESETWDARDQINSNLNTKYDNTAHNSLYVRRSFVISELGNSTIAFLLLHSDIRFVRYSVIG